MKVISSIAILLLFGNILIINAQQNYTITDFDRLLEEQSTQTRSQQNFDSQEIENLRNLVFELNPLVIVQGNEHSKMGEGDPELLIIPSNHLSQLASLQNELQSVVLILIKHSFTNVPATLDLSAIKTASLKYILIECDFECNPANIQSMLKNTSNVKVLYRTTTEQ